MDVLDAEPRPERKLVREPEDVADARADDEGGGVTRNRDQAGIDKLVPVATPMIPPIERFGMMK